MCYEKKDLIKIKNNKSKNAKNNQTQQPTKQLEQHEARQFSIPNSFFCSFHNTKQKYSMMEKSFLRKIIATMF
jgi:hypothetical protein